MFKLTVAFGPTGAMWALLFKTETAAINASVILHEAREKGSHIAINDEYGQTIHLDASQLVATFSENLEHSKLAHQELMLHDARIRTNANKAAQTDPQLRQSMNPGLGIINAGPTMPFPRARG